MKTSNMSVRLLLGLAMAVTTGLTGCARNYHSYADCQVPCTYCVPPPLPFAPYEGCVCHADAVAHHLSGPLPSPHSALGPVGQ